MLRSVTGAVWIGVLLGCSGVGGCPDSSMTLPHEDGPHRVDLTPNKVLPVRDRVPILPGDNSIPPPPEVAVHRDQCQDLEHGGSVDGPGCITADIGCGDTIIGHTIGGVRRFDTKFYEKKFCWPATEQHDGGDERIYRLEMPDGEWRAFVYLDSPCADLDLFGIKWSGDACPTMGHLVNQCEANLKRGTRGRERIELVHQGSATWFIVVEGKRDEEGPFALHVQCREGLN